MPPKVPPVKANIPDKDIGSSSPVPVPETGILYGMWYPLSEVSDSFMFSQCENIDV